ncbi:MAG TPA: helix-turn-helix domain-containing protein [Roseomonas sp.]|jgi:putative transcriptional regulator
MSKLGARMIAAAEEALAFAEGKDTGAVIHTVPDVKAIRQRLGLTQATFAARFGLPVGNVRDWEQRRSTPDGAARVLLRVIERAPDVVAEAAAG